MSNAIRWTPEQLADYEKKRKPAPLEIPVFVQPKPQPTESKLERRLSQQLADNPELPAHQRNYFFMSDRDFELDFAWPALKVGVEVQGMAHRIKKNFQRDIEKRALALLAGWRVLEVNGAAIKDGRALVWLRELLR